MNEREGYLESISKSFSSEIRCGGFDESDWMPDKKNGKLVVSYRVTICSLLFRNSFSVVLVPLVSVFQRW